MVLESLFDFRTGFMDNNVLASSNRVSNTGLSALNLHLTQNNRL